MSHFWIAEQRTSRVLLTSYYLIIKLISWKIIHFSVLTYFYALWWLCNMDKNERERQRVKLKKKSLDELREILSTKGRRPIINKRWTEEEILKNTYFYIKDLEKTVESMGICIPTPLNEI